MEPPRIRSLSSLSGSIVDLLTPFTASNAVDFEAFDRMINLHVCAGTSAVLVGSVTGESTALSIEEHFALYSAAARCAGGRIVVIAGIYQSSPGAACALASRAAAAGVDMVICSVPRMAYLGGCDIVDFFRNIALVSGLPVVVYDDPYSSAVVLSDETVLKLGSEPGIAGFIDASGDVDRTLRLIESAGLNFRIFSGMDSTAYDVMAAGGAGVVSVAANIMPRTMRTMCAAAAHGDAREAAALDASMMRLYQLLSSETGATTAKLLAEELGLMEPHIRILSPVRV
ncbi:dihydrodipicolinate synthase [Paraburkholderia hospita]|uniref:Dihydrodipicolinate synthase n=1 Tax=Paraburkholderia hospita TaxID=169430 RepID=A0ABN0FTQ4_9BURK|nr:dihydrodipicolinate synthase family protein [Paraburkholderia hospita]EIN02206.1 dihydrodipicolinate synthase [Paraburkholderia hospita]OUL90165.1 hypothetical protein CA602_07350 [Paraburkholderia hospita]